jgi:hypothetical protein
MFITFLIDCCVIGDLPYAFVGKGLLFPTLLLEEHFNSIALTIRFKRNAKELAKKKRIR